MLAVGGMRLAATIFAVWYAVAGASNGSIPVGNIAVLMMYLTRYYSPAVNLSKAYQSLQRGAISADRIVQFLSRESLSDMDQEVVQRKAQLELRSARVRLPNDDCVRVPDFSVAHTGLVLLRGDSGSGKSSLLRALIGVEADRLAGTVSLNGTSGASGAGSRIPFFSYAGQDNELIGDSVLGAVVYPSEPTTGPFPAGGDELDRVGLSHLGARSIVGDSVPLSGGEARRLVLARALYRPAPILVADEVTSNLDADSIRSIEDVLIDESRRRIVILATHNPGDRILSEATAIIEVEQEMVVASVDASLEPAPTP